MEPVVRRRSLQNYYHPPIIRGNQSPSIEIVVHDKSAKFQSDPLRTTVTATDEDVEYAELISTFVDAARKNTVEQTYIMAEALVTHRDLMKAGEIAK